MAEDLVVDIRIVTEADEIRQSWFSCKVCEPLKTNKNRTPSICSFDSHNLPIVQCHNCQARELKLPRSNKRISR